MPCIEVDLTNPIVICLVQWASTAWKTEKICGILDSRTSFLRQELQKMKTTEFRLNHGYFQDNIVVMNLKTLLYVHAT